MANISRLPQCTEGGDSDDSSMGVVVGVVPPPVPVPNHAGEVLLPVCICLCINIYILQSETRDVHSEGVWVCEEDAKRFLSLVAVMYGGPVPQTSTF